MRRWKRREGTAPVEAECLAGIPSWKGRWKKKKIINSNEGVGDKFKINDDQKAIELMDRYG